MYNTFLSNLKEFNKSGIPKDPAEVIKWYKDYCGLFYLFSYAKGAKLIKDSEHFLTIRRFRNMMEHSWPEGQKSLQDLERVKIKIGINQHLVAKELKDICNKIEKK